MEVKASLKHLRMSAQKIRLVIDLVRGLPVAAALDQLRFNNKLAARPVAKLLKSAIANGVNTYNLASDNLYIKEIKADEGVTLKRWMPRAHGRATSIRKRACHINLTLAEIKDSGKKEKKVVKAAEPVKLEKLAKEGEKTMAKNVVKADKDKNKKQAVLEKAKVFRRKSG
jgi:large subunit ribosomal protein L22